MRPLQSVAMGLVIVVLSARFHGYDALADPLGWLLVLAGVRGLPGTVESLGTLRALAVLAGLVSVVTWFPAVVDALADADESLIWTVNLPQLVFTALLCRALAAAAATAGDRRADSWLRVTLTLTVVVGLLPVLVFGAGVASLEVPAYLAAGVTALLVIWLLFAYSGRPWGVSRPVEGDRAG